MNRERYMQAMDSLPIRQDFNKRTFQQLKAAMETPPKFITPKKIALSAACLVLVVALGTVYANYGLKPSDTGSLMIGAESAVSVQSVQPQGGIIVPEMQLPETTGMGVASDMVPLFVYQGRVYVNWYSSGEYDENGLMTNREELLALRDQQLGKTKPTLDEWSKQSDYAVEFASNLGEVEIYTMKGYDSQHRLMAYEDYGDGSDPFIGVFESYGGMTLNTGEDFFSLLNLKGNVESVQYQDYNSWNNSLPNTKKNASADAFNTFLDALYASRPLGEQSEIYSEYTEYDSQKFVYVKTRDGLINQLRLFKNGIVSYSGVGLFQVDEKAFGTFWDTLPIEKPADSSNVLPPETPIVSTEPGFSGIGEESRAAVTEPQVSAPLNVSVTLEPKAYPVGTSSLTLKIRNNGTEQIAYGMEYSIEQQIESQENGTAVVKWQSVPQTDDLMFIALAVLLEPGQEQDFQVDLGSLQPPLSAGKYRIAKGVGGEMFYAEFELTK